MADTFLNNTGLAYYHNRIKTLFAEQADLDTLDAKVDEIIAEGGEPNVIEKVQRNDVDLPVNNKTVNVQVPTTVAELSDAADYAQKTDLPTKTSDLTNDSDYQTETEVQTLINAALADITEIDFQVVTELPATGVKGVIYLVPKTGTAQDVYNEYIWVTPTGGTAHFEPLGTTQVDLSGYWAKTELVAITTAQVDALFA